MVQGPKKFHVNKLYYYDGKSRPPQIHFINLGNSPSHSNGHHCDNFSMCTTRITHYHNNNGRVGFKWLEMRSPIPMVTVTTTSDCVQWESLMIMTTTNDWCRTARNLPSHSNGECCGTSSLHRRGIYHDHDNNE